MTRTSLISLLGAAALLAVLPACDSGGEPQSDGLSLPAEPGADLPRPDDNAGASGSTAPSFGPAQAEEQGAGAESGAPSGGPGAIGDGGSTASGGGGDDPGLTCLELYDAVAACYESYYNCASACQDQSCADSCETTYWACYDGKVEQGSQVGNQQFEDLRVCEETHYQGCYGQGETVYNECAGACVNEACVQACAEGANQALMQCMVDVCGLVYQVCGVEILDAGEETDPADTAGGAESLEEEPQDEVDSADSGGPTACASLYECEDACDGEQACGQACYDAATEQAKSQWSALIQCGIQHCNNQVGDAASYKVCLQQSCADVYATCFGGVPSGGSGGGAGSDGNGGGSLGAGGTCGEGYVCIQDCYATSTNEQAFYACIDLCYAAMGDAAMNLLDELGGCSNVMCADVPGSIENYYKCQQDFCPNQYNACMSQTAGGAGGGGGWSDPGAGTGTENLTCADVYDGVFQVCIPAYSSCSAGCGSDACVQSCKDDIDACIANEKSKAPSAEAEAFQAVTDCRSANYQTCYDSSNSMWQGCMASCMPGDSACESACNDSANENYEDCFVPLCFSEYQTCGIL